MVPITSDLAGYLAFWRGIATGAAIVAGIVIGELALIAWLLWRR